MNNLLIEIGFEDLPNNYHNLLNNFIKNLRTNFYKEYFSFKSIKIFTTSKRIALLINNILSKKELVYKKELYIKNIIQISLNILLNNKSNFQKMRWGKNNYKFIRPVNWLLVLFNNDVIKINLFNFISNRKSYGHVIHYNKEIILNNSNEYLLKLKYPGYTLVDFNYRLEIIRNMILYLAKKNNLLVNLDKKILVYIAKLVEWPVAMIITFNKIFKKLPKEILIFLIKDKKKSFNLFYKKNLITNKYIIIVNLNTLNKHKLILNNEKNINIFFNDILFFLLYDFKKKLYERYKDLELVIFQYKLGSLADKTRRIINSIKKYILYIGGNLKLAIRSAYLSKCDFITSFVKEFNFFKGFIGSYYSFINKEKKEVYKTIYQQYLPNKYNNLLPYTKEGISLSLSNKFDDLIGYFYIGYIPSSSADIFFTRRIAYRILKIIIFNEYNLDLFLLINYSISQYNNYILNKNIFIKQILKFLLEKIIYLIKKNNMNKKIYFSIKSTSFCPYDLFRRIKNINFLLNKKKLIYKIIFLNKRIINFIKKYKNLYKTLFLFKKVNIKFFKKNLEYNLFNSINFYINNFYYLIKKGICNYKDIFFYIYLIYKKTNYFINNIKIFRTKNIFSKNNILLLIYINNIFITLADFIGLVGFEPTTKGL
ncbi:glycine--tRNA ligase subunit beta [Candidatus Portiera aleyrodidarum]|uniref:Glycine--tRNA ligase beta subunit n=1 Tax=Candidatus Portiera aleyrodidarum TaxID=91844 RepID=A0A8D9JQA5_9GAMM|nr:glycine--tRNA ligase subunit beta [Candidatus Portiera aleyrodidarum]CEI58846.1 Glycine--tRNA ligase beta subunit [Candidatus Portiera aleyrodidarum]